MIEIPCATIEKIRFDIIRIRYRNEYRVQLKDVQEVNDVFEQLSEGRCVYCIVNSKGSYSNFSKDALDYLAKDAPMVKRNLLKSSAVVIDNMPSRLIVKFFLKFHKPKFPMKICSTEQQAVEWIFSLKSTNRD